MPTATIIAIAACLILLLASSREIDVLEFLQLTLLTMAKILLAYCISVGIALGAILLVDLLPKLEETFENLFDVLQSLPSIALLPALTLLLGRNDTVTVTVVTLAMLWPILFSLLSARKQLDNELKEVARIYGARGWRYYWYVLFPMSIPNFVTGSIVAWGEAWETAIAAELVIMVAGIGGFFQESSADPRLIAVIACFMSLLYLLSRLVWTPLLKFSSNFTN
jgi:NitT/TauT family transport system permease protein